LEPVLGGTVQIDPGRPVCWFWPWAAQRFDLNVSNMQSLLTKPAQAPPAESAVATQRLMSVDALRGFDMFWIIGADSLVYALNRMSHTRTTGFLAGELEHAEWAGFHFYDLIAPRCGRCSTML
jgi:hypothetical protein